MTAELNGLDTLGDLPTDRDVLVFGRRGRLLSDDLVGRLPAAVRPTWSAMVDRTRPGDGGRSTHTWWGEHRLTVGVLPESCSRHNAPSRAWAIPGIVKAAGGSKPLTVVAVLDDDAHAVAVAAAAARALPRFSDRSRQPAMRDVQLALLGPQGVVDPREAVAVAEAVRRAAELVDTPPDVLTPPAFVEAARAVARDLPGVELTVIAGEQLVEQGFGGIWGVGKASDHPPALVALDWAPEGATRSMAWVGKGITYDTGGLSIKSKSGMPGMKTDMGGAAAVLHAFAAAVTSGTSVRLTAVLCLAENAVGPGSTRPDDILHMKSGRTVEINNTDAEGRLVLADGVAWVATERTPDAVVDCATLTGAQLVATGKVHAAVVCNDDALEQAAVRAGRRTGDLVHPLPFAPELYRKEFRSHVADLKNSVKDRANAQTSCAAQFVHEHLRPHHEGPWLHVDLAGPAVSGGRGTGFGVALLVGLLHELKHA